MQQPEVAIASDLPHSEPHNFFRYYATERGLANFFENGGVVALVCQSADCKDVACLPVAKDTDLPMYCQPCVKQSGFKRVEK